MSARFSKSLVMSVGVHLALGGLMCWLMLRTAEPVAPVEMKPVRVFTTSPAPADAGVTPPAGSSASATPATSVRFNPLPPPPPPRVREAVTDEAAVEPSPPPPVRPRPAPPAVAPTPRPTPPTIASTKPTTLAEHRKLHPLSNPPTTAGGPGRTTTSEPPKINMGAVLGEASVTDPKPGAGSGPAVTPAASAGGGETPAAYLDRLFAKLRAEHQKPEGLDDGLQARVEFVVRADGSVTGVRILKTSGNAEFDASVLAAFRQVSGLGSPPAGVTGVNAVTFRTRAD